MKKVIEERPLGKYRLTKIENDRVHDQHYERVEPQGDHNDHIILAGYNKAKNVQEGDEGEMVYRSEPGRGLAWFTKNKAEETS